MKKIFLIAVVLLMMINFIINYHHEVTKEQHTPMADFKTKVEMAPMRNTMIRTSATLSSILASSSRRILRYRDTRAMPVSHSPIMPISSWRVTLPITIAIPSRLVPILLPRSFIQRGRCRRRIKHSSSPVLSMKTE